MGRIGKDDQPEDRDEEAGECTVHQVRENPDQHESDSWREPGKQYEQTPHPPTFPSGPRCEPLDTTLQKSPSDLRSQKFSHRCRPQYGRRMHSPRKILGSVRALVRSSADVLETHLPATGKPL